MEIIVERLEREFNLAVVTTSPSVVYKVILNDGTVEMIQNPTNLPDPAEMDHIEEPIVKADIMIPKEYVGTIMELCQQRRGKMLSMDYITTERVDLHYEMPLNEVIYDFFDALKSKTKGYGSLDYEFIRYEKSSLVKLDVLLNKDLVDAFSMENNCPQEIKKKMIEETLKGHSTCALGTCGEDGPRVTPIEYRFVDWHLYFLSEGGKKFANLEGDDRVSVAIFESYGGFENLMLYRGFRI